MVRIIVINYRGVHDLILNQLNIIPQHTNNLQDNNQRLIIRKQIHLK